MKKEKVVNLKNQHEKKDGQGSFGMVNNSVKPPRPLETRKNGDEKKKIKEREKQKIF